MKAAIYFTSFYISAFLLLLLVLCISLKSCAHPVQEAESILAYQAQFQNANEHEVFVRRLGDK